LTSNADFDDGRRDYFEEMKQVDFSESDSSSVYVKQKAPKPRPMNVSTVGRLENPVNQSQLSAFTASAKVSKFKEVEYDNASNTNIYSVKSKKKQKKSTF
jgi:hypothetical protein